MEPYYEDEWATIYHADCRDVLPHVDADVMVTDPPYGMAFSTQRINGDWSSRWKDVAIQGDDDTSLRDHVLASWDGPALVFGTWKCPMPTGVRETLVWDKIVSTGTGALDIPWRPSWEAIYVIGRGFVGRRGHGVLRYALPTLAPDRKWHPTPKPVDLMRDLIGKCPLGVVIDPFMGSGTTLRAAKDLGRRSIGIEVEERYCRIAVQRLRQEVLGI